MVIDQEIDTRAGGILRCVHSWKNITRNNFILRIASEGYKLQLFEKACLPQSVVTSTNNPIKHLSIQTQINNHLSSGAISEVKFSEDQLLSRVFLVKKSNNDDRLIIDLSKLNLLIPKISFKMETHDKIKEILQCNDFMASIDLSDAFFTVPLHESSKKFVCFQFDDKRYSYNVLPFGLTSSPRIFSKMLKSVINHQRSLGIKITFYIDDIFICSHCPNILKNHVSSTLNLLISLGFRPNFKKSHLIPSHNIIHLGYNWNSVEMSISVPNDKICKTKDLANKLLKENPTLQLIASFLGIVISHRTAFQLAPIYYRDIQLQYCSLVKLGTPYDSIVSLNEASISNLKWWSTADNYPPLSLTPIKANLTLHTDASKVGWGGVLSNGSFTSGTWTSTESDLHINILELKAVILSLSTFINEISDNNIYIYSDNSTTVHYINKIGGTHSDYLCHLSIELWNMLVINKVKCTAFHVPGELNTLADFYSRSQVDRHDYHLSNHTFQLILINSIVQPSCDLFASCDTFKLPSYVSFTNDPNAIRVDAFSFVWISNLYMFPPLPLLSKVIQKIRNDQAENIILITPAWPGLVSLPIILSLLISNPIFIHSNHLLGQPPTRYPFNMMAWNISSNAASINSYQRKLAQHSLPVSQRAPYHLTKDTGNTFVNMLSLKGHHVICLPH